MGDPARRVVGRGQSRLAAAMGKGVCVPKQRRSIALVGFDSAALVGRPPVLSGVPRFAVRLWLPVGVSPASNA